MITVLIRVTQGPEALAVTLSALVPAVADGLVADAIILTATRDEAIGGVAEAAGATLVVAPVLSWQDAAERARHPLAALSRGWRRAAGGLDPGA